MVKLELDGGAWIEVGPTTPRVRLTFSSLQSRSLEFYEEYAKQLGIHVDALDTLLSELILISANARESSGLDFDLLSMSDTEDEIKFKFQGFLDTRFNTLAVKVRNAVKLLDSPGSTTTGPAPLAEDAPKS